MASAQNLLGFCFFACASETPFSWIWPGGLQASKSYVALCLAWGNLSQPFFFVFSRFQKQRFGTFLAAVSYGVGTILLSFLGTLYFFLFSGFQKRRFGIFLAAVSQWLRHKTCWGSAFSMRSRRSFLGLCLVAAVSQWLGHDFIVFRGSKRNVFRMRSRRSFLGLCLVAAVSQWLGHDFIVFLGFQKQHVFIVFKGSKSNVSRFLRLHSCNGLDAKPAGALLFRMRSRRSFFGLCLVAAVSQWLGNDFIVFGGSKSNTFSLFFIVFRGAKSNVSRFLRLYSCNGLDAKPAGALLFRMRSRRSFLGFCLVAAVLQWLGHDFIVFRNSKSNVSRFLRLHSCNGLDAKPAGALLFRMRSRRIFLRLCPVAEVSPMQLSDAALKFSTGF